MIKDLKQRVFEANMLLPKYNLVMFTWGNVSEIDRKNNLIAIKPSGVKYEDLKIDDIVVLNLNGDIIEGELNPSSDTDTHLELYRNFFDIGGIVHTHSRWATIWAQSGKAIKPYGTTHGDYFYGEIPCTRLMTAAEIAADYELNTGKVIAETFESINPMDMPAVLVHGHGPFTWGADADNAVHNAAVLEELALMAYYTEANGNTVPMQKELLDKHFFRKHGEGAYYGQENKK